eukprot:jgi/Mesvir1/11267/Mv01067-RA.1
MGCLSSKPRTPRFTEFSIPPPASHTLPRSPSGTSSAAGKFSTDGIASVEAAGQAGGKSTKSVTPATTRVVVNGASAEPPAGPRDAGSAAGAIPKQPTPAVGDARPLRLPPTTREGAWRDVALPPSKFKGHKSAMPPDITVDLEHVYGFRGWDTAQAAQYLSNREVVYIVATLGVVHDLVSNKQQFYTGHNADVGMLALHPGSSLAATVQQPSPGGASSGVDPCIHLWSTRTLKRRGHPLHPHDRGVSSLAFNPPGTRLLVVCADVDHTLVLYNTENGAEVARARGTMGRVRDALFLCPGGVGPATAMSNSSSGASSARHHAAPQQLAVDVDAQFALASDTCVRFYVVPKDGLATILARNAPGSARKSISVPAKGSNSGNANRSGSALNSGNTSHNANHGMNGAAASISPPSTDASVMGVVEMYHYSVFSPGGASGGPSTTMSTPTTTQTLTVTPNASQGSPQPPSPPPQGLSANTQHASPSPMTSSTSQPSSREAPSAAIASTLPYSDANDGGEDEGDSGMAPPTHDLAGKPSLPPPHTPAPPPQPDKGKGKLSPVTCLAAHPQGLVVTGLASGRLQLWDPGSCAVVASVAAHRGGSGGGVTALCCCPHRFGGLIVSGSGRARGGELCVFDAELNLLAVHRLAALVARGGGRRTPGGGSGRDGMGGVCSLSISPDGSNCLIGLTSGAVLQALMDWLWILDGHGGGVPHVTTTNAASATKNASGSFSAPTAGAAKGTDSTRSSSTSGGGGGAGGKPSPRELCGLALHPSRALAVTAGDDLVVRFWDMELRACIARGFLGWPLPSNTRHGNAGHRVMPEGDAAPPHASGKSAKNTQAAAMPAGQRALAVRSRSETGAAPVGSTGAVAAGGTVPEEGPHGHLLRLRCAAWSADGSLVAVGRSDGAVFILATVGVPFAPQRTVHVLVGAPGPDGSATRAGGGLATTNTAGSSLDEGSVAAAGVSALVFSPDGRHLAVGTRDGMVRVWDVSAVERAGGPGTGVDDPASGGVAVGARIVVGYAPPFSGGQAKLGPASGGAQQKGAHAKSSKQAKNGSNAGQDKAVTPCTCASQFWRHCKGSTIAALDWSIEGDLIQSATSGPAFELLFWEAMTGSLVPASLARDKEWAEWTLPVGWPVTGLWPLRPDSADTKNAGNRTAGSQGGRGGGSAATAGRVTCVHRCTCSPGQGVGGAAFIATGDELGRARVYRYPITEEKAQSVAGRMGSGHCNRVRCIRMGFQGWLLSVGGVDCALMQWRWEPNHN